MSAVGIKECPVEQQFQVVQERLPSGLQKYGHYQLHHLWDNARISPYDPARTFPFIIKGLIKNSIDRRMKLNDPTIVPKIAFYIEQLIMRKKSSEVGVT